VDRCIGKKVEIVFVLKIKTKEFMATNFNPEHKEGPVARMIEEQTAKLPSDYFYGQQLVLLRCLQ